jgi:hypothetical protein
MEKSTSNDGMVEDEPAKGAEARHYILVNFI